MSDLDFTNKRVLVVGGSSGIGNGVAHSFRARGARVCVWGTKPSAADYAGQEGSDLTGLGYSGVDVGDPDAIEAAPAPFDGLDVLVLCQGIVVYSRGEFERPGWDKVMAVNLDSLMHICRRFKPDLAETRGSIIIVSSIAGLKANKGNPAYAASKAGAISLTRTLGQAWRTSCGWTPRQRSLRQRRRQPARRTGGKGESLWWAARGSTMLFAPRSNRPRRRPHCRLARTSAAPIGSSERSSARRGAEAASSSP